MAINAFTNEKQLEFQKKMDSIGLDLLVILNSESAPNINISALTGYTTWGILLISKSGERILGAYDVPVAKQMGHMDKVKQLHNWYRGKSPEIIEDIKRLGGTHPVIGVPGNFKISEYHYLTRLLQDTLPNSIISPNTKSVDILLDSLRSIKNPDELKALERSINIADSMKPVILEFLNTQKTASELDLSYTVEQEMRKQGADGLAFESLVANGDRSWQIHAIPAASGALLRKGSLGLIDYGCTYQGYCSDITIPFGFGPLPEKAMKVRKLVEIASNAAIEALEIGVKLSEIADLVDTLLKDAGHPLPHSLGHGLGLTVHDSPFIRPSSIDKNSSTIEPGMAFTIEPGVYVEGFGGVRIENDILVYDAGPKCISHSEFLDIK